jgi:predicted unusual protein kinase regulating ubiquinone biosynthesis (AarF/ABC1/UbiB family)
MLQMDLEILNAILPITSIHLIHESEDTKLYKLNDGYVLKVLLDEDMDSHIEVQNMAIGRELLGDLVPKVLNHSKSLILMTWIDGEHIPNPDAKHIRNVLKDKTSNYVDSNDPRIFEIHSHKNMKLSSKEWMNKRISDINEELESRNLEKINAKWDFDEEIFFQHNDLHFRNILTKNGELVGLLDWECAGFYPSHYEVARLNFMKAANNFDKIDDDIQTLENTLLEYEMLKYNFSNTQVLNILNNQRS